MADLSQFIDPSILDDAATPAVHRYQTGAPVVIAPKEEDDGPTAGEVAAAMWRRESIIGSMLNDDRGAMEGDAAQHEEGFNPVRYWREKGEDPELESFIRNGAFDRIYNAAQFERLSAQIAREKEDLKTIEQGSFGGMALGMGFTLFDVLTLVPFAGAVRGASRLYNVARVGASGAALSGAQEAYLHGGQATRTAFESYMNIGLTTALAGGLGSLVGIHAPSHPLNPKNGAKALDANEQHPVAIGVPGQAMSEAEKLDSVGAARVSEETREAVEGSTKMAGGDSIIGKLTSGRYFGRGVTPAGRSTMWSSPVARESTQGLADIGGIITKGAANAEGVRASAEDILMDHMLLHDGASLVHRDAFQDMAVDLGKAMGPVSLRLKQDLGMVTGGRVGNTGISQQVFDEIVWRKLNSDSWRKGFNWPLGSNDPDTQWFADRLQDAGLTEDAAKVVSKYTDVAAKKWKESQEELGNRMVAHGMIDKEDLLDDYGTARLYNRNAIQNDPEGFKAELLEILEKQPTDEWLEEAHGLTRKQWNDLPIEDPKRMEIMEEWSGDVDQLRLQRAEQQLAVAKDRLKAETELAAWIELGYKAEMTDRAHLRTEELQAFVKSQESEYALRGLTQYGQRVTVAETRVARLRDEIAKYQKERVDTEAVMPGLKDAAKAASGAAKAATGEVGAFTKQLDSIGKKMDDLVERDTVGKPSRAAALENPRTFDDLMNEFQRESAMLEQAKAQYAEQRAAVSANAKALGIADKRLDEIDRLIQRREDWMKGENALVKLEENGKALQRQMDRFFERKNAWAKAREARKAADESLKLIRAGRKASAKAISGLKKDIKSAEKELAKSPLLEAIEQVMSAIADRERFPMGVLRNHVAETGRSKERKLPLTDAQLRRLADRGFMHKDINYVQERTFRDVGARLALRERFGEESLAKTKDAITKDYERLIKGAQTEKAKSKLRGEMKDAIRDVDVLKDRILGRNRMGEDDHDSIVSWGLEKLKQTAYMAFAAGFPIASLADYAATVLTGTVGRNNLIAAKKMYKFLKDNNIPRDDREIALIATGAEQSMARSTASRQYLTENQLDDLGIGRDGSLLKGATAKIDRVLAAGVNRMHVYSGMAGMNKVNKMMATFTQAQNIKDRILKYESLSPRDKQQLAVLGIGRAEAERMAKLVEKHGEEFAVNAHLWGDEEMHRVWRVALRRTSNRAVLTPGYADMPLMMDKRSGRFLLMFQSFSYASINRYFTPALQRTLMQGDLQAMSSILTLFTLGSLITVIRSYQNGKDIEDMETREWVDQVIDRSGLLMHMSPYVDAGRKLFGLEGSSRYQANNAWMSLLGPGFGQLAKTFSAGASLAEGDMEKARDKAMLLMPFNQWWRFGNAVANQE